MAEKQHEKMKELRTSWFDYGEAAEAAGTNTRTAFETAGNAIEGAITRAGAFIGKLNLIPKDIGLRINAEYNIPDVPYIPPQYYDLIGRIPTVEERGGETIHTGTDFVKTTGWKYLERGEQVVGKADVSPDKIQGQSVRDITVNVYWEGNISSDQDREELFNEMAIRTRDAIAVRGF